MPKISKHDLKVSDEEISSLKTYDKNPRIGDISVIADSLSAFGQFKPIVAQLSTRKVLAGNHTLMAAKKLGWKTISTVFLDVDDDEAARIVLADNRSSDFGGYDEDILADLLDTIQSIEGTGYSQTDLENLSNTVASIFIPDDSPEDLEILPDEVEWDDLSDESDGIVELRDDIVFLPVLDPTNIYEIPELLEDRIADIRGCDYDTWVGPDFSPERDTPDKSWLYIVRTSTTGIPWDRATVGFFTRDYRFESWWESPSKHTQRILNLGVTTVMEPDFTTFAGNPNIVSMWQIYRQRWLARYFQEAGLMVIPNFSCLLGSEDRRSLVLAGFPAEPLSGCLQFQTIKSDDDSYREIAHAVNRVLNEWSCPKALLVYGGDKASRVMEKVSYDGEVIITGAYTTLRMDLAEKRRNDTGTERMSPL
ncbi:ParB/Sulfiredoxin [uncultured Caudovirales phage]|uniref:ParB/Sulfiredoxin n=1 Tax=uncultured Caudovirales phage TaxID=2100421 RepID=A0A6J5PY04_9CAUD|nr:ParB/Sulfiredoxin [uncultured Caudovirales phage]